MIRARDKVLLWTSGLTLVPAVLIVGWQAAMARSNAAVTTLPLESNPRRSGSSRSGSGAVAAGSSRLSRHSVNGRRRSTCSS
jgi:hypothetical protein